MCWLYTLHMDTLHDGIELLVSLRTYAYYSISHGATINPLVAMAALCPSSVVKYPQLRALSRR